MRDLIDQLVLRLDFRQIWWRWDPGTAGLWDRVYRGFNLLESITWMVIAILVAVRWFRNRRSSGELVYAFVFLLFGLTDLREAFEQSLGLVLVKGGVLASLLILRHCSVRRWYPNRRLY